MDDGSVNNIPVSCFENCRNCLASALSLSGSVFLLGVKDAISLRQEDEPHKVFGNKHCFFRRDVCKLIESISSHWATNPEDYLPLKSPKDQGTIALSCTLANV